MSNYDELIGILKELLFNRFLPEPKIIKGLLGDGTGVVRVPGRKDFNYARFNRGSTESFEVFNKTVPEVNDWPILISELPWQPGLTQVVGTDWESYIQSGWGDSVSTSNPHAPTHEWRDKYIGSDPLSIYMRAIAPGRAYSSSSTGSVVFVNSFEYGTGTIWPGVPGVDLSPLMTSIPTGTARFAGVYVNPVSNSLGVVTGNTSVDTQAFDPPLVTFPFGTIPIARIRLYGGQGGLLENDFRDARRLFDVPPTGTSSGLGGVWPAANQIKINETEYDSVADVASAANSGDVIKFGEGVFDCDGVVFPDGVWLVSAGNTTLYTDANANCVVFDEGGYIINIRIENEFSNPSAVNSAFRQNTSAVKAYLYNCEIQCTNPGVDGSAWATIAYDAELWNCRSIGTHMGIVSQTEISLFSGYYAGGTADIVAVGTTAILNYPVLENGTFSASGGTVSGIWTSGSGSSITLQQDGFIDFDERASAPTTPSTSHWRIYSKLDGFYQVDDAGTETKLTGAPTDAQYYVAALHAGLSAEIVPSLDTFKVSKLAASDGSPDPAWHVDASGILTTDSERLDMDGKAIILDADGDTYFAGDIDDQITYVISSSQAARMDTGGLYITRIAEAAWFDFPLQDVNDLAGVASHFRDNTSTYPTGWTESDAPAATNTNANYSFWKILGTSSDTAWGYNRQTSINLESESANAWTTFMVGPILLKDGRYSADISYHFGIYRNNAGAIDTATYSRMRIWWDSASSLWKLVAEERDGSTAHSTTLSLDQNPLQPLFLAFTVQNAAAKNTRQMWGSTPIVGSMRTNAQAPTSAPTWGQMWVRFHQSRGAGVTDAISIGALDYLGSVIE